MAEYLLKREIKIALYSLVWSRFFSPLWFLSERTRLGKSMSGRASKRKLQEADVIDLM